MAGFNGWDVGVLRALGAPLTRANLQALDAWQRAEGGGASFNPLNTTQTAPGASSYNGVGVRNFLNPQQGLQATVATLLNGHYGNIVNDLRSGQSSAARIATDVANSPWGTGSGVLRVLGASPTSAGSSNGRTPGSDPGSVGSTPAPAAMPTTIPGLSGTKAALVMGLLSQAAQDFGQGGGTNFDPSGILALALSRRTSGAAQQTFGSQPKAGTRVMASAYPTTTANGLKVTGASLQGTDPHFWHAVSTAASMAGATAIRLNSARRSEAHNAAVGGVSNSNHLTGHAVDGEAFIPGRGWIPLGDLPTLRRVGLRSGDQPGFFNGRPDPVHVDDAFNQGT